jgi:hypothetical protein
MFTSTVKVATAAVESGPHAPVLQADIIGGMVAVYERFGEGYESGHVIAMLGWWVVVSTRIEIISVV